MEKPSYTPRFTTQQISAIEPVEIQYISQASHAYCQLSRKLMEQPFKNGKKTLYTNYSDARIVELLNQEAQRLNTTQGWKGESPYLEVHTHKVQGTDFYALELVNTKQYIDPKKLEHSYKVIIQALKKGWVYDLKSPECQFTKLTYAKDEAVLIKLLANKLGLFPHKIHCNHISAYFNKNGIQPSQILCFTIIKKDSFQEIAQSQFINLPIPQYIPSEAI